MMPSQNFAVAMATLIWPDGRFPSDAEAAASVRVTELLMLSRVTGEPVPATAAALVRDMASALFLDGVEQDDVRAVMAVTALIMQREGVTVSEGVTMRLYDLLGTLARDLEGGAA